MGGRYPGPMALTGTMWLISTLSWPTTNHRAKLDFEGCKILSLREKLPDIFEVQQTATNVIYTGLLGLLSRRLCAERPRRDPKRAATPAALSYRPPSSEDPEPAAECSSAGR